ncbi:MAG: hypothetical protein GXO25_00215 [Euryarchaeota archaeon]|nr:hypothetical protein [Euryarchaeota archaeon]
MIGEEIKKIREAEEKAEMLVREAQENSKKRVESFKKEIQDRIAAERKELMARGEAMKKSAEETANKEAKLVRSKYLEKAEKIKAIDDDKVKETASEIIHELLR